MFELVLDLKVLVSDHATADKFHAFARVAKFHKASRLKTFLDANRLVQQLAATAVEVVADEFHLLLTDLNLRDRLRRVSAAAGFYAVQSVLEQQKVVSVR